MVGSSGRVGEGLGSPDEGPEQELGQAEAGLVVVGLGGDHLDEGSGAARRFEDGRRRLQEPQAADLGGFQSPGEAFGRQPVAMVSSALTADSIGDVACTCPTWPARLTRLV